MPFIKGIWYEPQNQSKEQPKKIIKSSQVTLKTMYSRPVGKTYRMVFQMLLANGNVFDPKPIQMRDIDRRSLEKVIRTKIGSYDAKYMKLVSYSTNKVTFDFDYQKWFNDALQGVNPNNRVSKFEQRFKFKKPIPKMISYTVNMEFPNFMVRKFKEYMDKNRKHKTWFEKFLPREISSKIRTGISHMFEYSYNAQTNEIVAKLKDIYIMGILFAVGHATTRVLRGQKLINIDFEKSVRRKSKKFDRRKWERFIKKKFI